METLPKVESVMYVRSSIQITTRKRLSAEESIAFKKWCGSLPGVQSVTPDKRNQEFLLELTSKKREPVEQLYLYLQRALEPAFRYHVSLYIRKLTGLQDGRSLLGVIFAQKISPKESEDLEKRLVELCQTSLNETVSYPTGNPRLIALAVAGKLLYQREHESIKAWRTFFRHAGIAVATVIPDVSPGTLEQAVFAMRNLVAD